MLTTSIEKKIFVLLRLDNWSVVLEKYPILPYVLFYQSALVLE
jgi:hypothetical protein